MLVLKTNWKFKKEFALLRKNDLFNEADHQNMEGSWTFVKPGEHAWASLL